MSATHLKVMNGPQSAGDRLRLMWRRAEYGITGRNPRKLLFIACFPKSGSTYFMRLLHEITGFPRVQPVEALGANEQEFCLDELQRIQFQDGVCHQHVKATKRNLELADKFGIRPVVLVRNIFDVVPSLIDHFQRENRWFPTGFVPEDFSEWTVEEQSMFVIRVHLPWYFSFIMSWEEAAQSHSVCWLTYEELFEDTLSTVKVACNFWNYPVDDGIVLSAIAAMDGRNTRLNKGISGRGQQLPEYQKCEIKNLAASCCLSANSLRMIGLGSGISIGNCYSA